MPNLKVVRQLSISRNTHEVYDPEPEMSDISREKQRLLIVDDSKVIRVTARKILRDHFETIEAVDGENAWEILNSDEPVSLVVSDLNRPKPSRFGMVRSETTRETGASLLRISQAFSPSRASMVSK